MKPPPTCFVSYSHETDDHKAWVRKLAEALSGKHVVVRLDQYDLKPGHDLAHYMESAVRETDFVLQVCTPAYAEKANSNSGGVGYEKGVITGEIVSATPGFREKFIPLLRSGSHAEAVPSFLKNRVFVDFRDDSDDAFEKSVEELAHVLHGVPIHDRPPLGARPSFATEEADGKKAEPDPES